MKQVYASFWRRSLARVIDLIFVLGVCGFFYLVNRFLGFPLRYSSLFEARHVTSFEMFMFYDFPGVGLTFLSVKLLVAYPYFALMESGRRQGTLGKMAMGIKVTDLSGNRISFGRATARYFSKIMSTTLLMLGYVISFSNLRQTCHDYMARTLVLGKDFSPAFDVLPRVSSRFMFDLPGFAGEESDLTGAKYMCPFCSYRSNEKLQFGVGRCAGCGTRWPNGEVGAMKASQIMGGILFIAISGFCFYFSAIVLNGILRGDKISWWIFAILFGLGGILAAGGVSSFFGKSWLFRLLMAYSVVFRDYGSRSKR